MTLEQKTTIPLALQYPELFKPNTFIPNEEDLIRENLSGALYRIGSNELGDYYQVKTKNQNYLNVILLDRSYRKISLKEHPQDVDLHPIIESVKQQEEHIYFPSGIAPLHRISQEFVRDHWELINPILKSDQGKKIIDPRCFLEVELDKNKGISEGIADAIGLTANGNFIIMEHTSIPTISQNGSSAKYRQVERHAKLFLREFGPDLSVRPVCVFYQPLDEQTMFLKIGHANQMQLVA